MNILKNIIEKYILLQEKINKTLNKFSFLTYILVLFYTFIYTLEYSNDIEHFSEFFHKWDNRARKSRRTLQNKVRIKVFPEQLTLFINTAVALKQCIIQ